MTNLKDYHNYQTTFIYNGFTFCVEATYYKGYSKTLTDPACPESIDVINCLISRDGKTVDALNNSEKEVEEFLGIEDFYNDFWDNFLEEEFLKSVRYELDSY